MGIFGLKRVAMPGRRRTREEMQADFDAWILKGRMKKARKPPKRRRPGPPRRGRVVDEKYMEWLATQPPLVSGPGPLTIHHVRRFGEAKNDRRTVPLAASRHLIQHGPRFSIEVLGKAKFEARYGVDLEAAIVRYNQQYEQELKWIALRGMR
jgi:hypothetical protein